MNHTDLEQKEIDDVYKIIKKNNKINIKNINNITNNIVTEMYTNKKVIGIYNKKTVAIETLNKLFIHDTELEDEHQIEETEGKINSMATKIDKLINKYDYIKSQKNDRCSKCIVS
jgi:hypothetical protein